MPHDISNELKPVTIKEKCYIGCNTTILPGIIIEKNSVVGAGSVVTRDVDKNTIIAGNPAKFLKNANQPPKDNT